MVGRLRINKKVRNKSFLNIREKKKWEKGKIRYEITLKFICSISSKGER